MLLGCKRNKQYHSRNVQIFDDMKMSSKHDNVKDDCYAARKVQLESQATERKDNIHNYNAV